eukprot:scaffold38967_cov67-Phaeocystis_antarctica.AAC.1
MLNKRVGRKTAGVLQDIHVPRQHCGCHERSKGRKVSVDPSTHRLPCRPHRGRCTRFRSLLATPGVRGDLLWRDLYVRDGVVSTVPSTSSVAAACRRELLSAVVFSRVAGAWPMVARTLILVTALQRRLRRKAVAKLCEWPSSRCVSDSSRYVRWRAQYAARRLVLVKVDLPKGRP